MKRMSGLLRASCALAGGIGAALAWLAVGCGGETLPAVDVAALNAELAQAESDLADRLAALEPGAVEEACRFAAAALEEGERRVAELPEGEAEARMTLAAALVQFREGAEGLGEEVVTAVREERDARAGAEAELEALRAARRRFAEEVEPGLPGWAGTVQETGVRLASWREQRLEKMEDRQYQTFPAFHEAAAACYGEWRAWAEEAGALGDTALGELRPAVAAAAARLAERTAAAVAARVREEEGIAAIRAIPVSQALVAAARRAAVATYNGTIRGAAVAMAGMEKATAGCPADIRQRVEDLRADADDLEMAVEGLSGDIQGQMAAGAVPEALAAAARARETCGDVVAATDEFEAEREGLRQAWAPLKEEMKGAADAAGEIQKMAQTDEEVLARDIAILESLRRRIEEARIGEWCGRLEAFRGGAEASLGEAEAKLARARDAYMAAMTAAARKAARTSLGKLRASLDQRPAPGWTRPETKVKKARAEIDGFLSHLDSMTDNEFMEENKRVSESVGKMVEEIAEKTVWKPGTKHPEIPHIHAADKERTWSNDPGYEFVDSSPGSTNIMVRWKPGAWHPDHPNVTAGHTEGTWVPNPGYKARRWGDLDPVWTPGTRHTDRPHIHASVENGKNVWSADPGYTFVEPNSYNLDVRWVSGRRHPDHPHVSSGTLEGTWIPDPGYKTRWNGDLDPVWTPGVKHPDIPHIHASNKERTWTNDPGYEFVDLSPGATNLTVSWKPGSTNLPARWAPGLSHPDYKGIESAEEENRWRLKPGWTWVNPGTSDLRTRWVPGSTMPGAPHVHASNTEGQWTPDAGYRWRSVANDGDFSVEWVGR